ncbi:golgin subfamily A member 6-like protein 26 [Uranotaenia lowii]|uniref:golgin subfamily A member 6-like protein 26 n=1 Tax=Uranotaenia lowii TaxID=190385 RepID=UPI0024797D26|nr:golgin subfamily A member 6-like protein 26 [Uranotaenia lowii]
MDCARSSADSKLDIDLSSILKETQNMFESFHKLRNGLRFSQLEAKLFKDQMTSLKQQMDSSSSSDWIRFSKNLNNMLQVVSDRKDVAEYESTIQQLKGENDFLKQQLEALKSDRETEINQLKQTNQEQLIRETAQFTKQISELTIHKELAASEASIRYDQLQSRLEKLQQEHESRLGNMAQHYERLLETLTTQKQKLREENETLRRSEENLREQLARIQNHSTDFLMNRSRTITPSADPLRGSQRYTEVVMTKPCSQKSTTVSATVSQRQSLPVNESTQANNTTQATHEIAEVSSSSSRNSTRSMTSSGRINKSPQHPGFGGHVTKPRKKRKLFTQTVE